MVRLAPVAAVMAVVAASCTASSSGPGQSGSTAAVRGERPFTVSRIDAPAPQASGRWAERVAAAAVAGKGGDLDGDGVGDLFVGQPRYSTPATRNAGRVWAVSGKTGKVLYPIDPPEPQADAKFGFATATLGDVDGDGKSDVAVGTDAQNVAGNMGQGAAWVFSGATGKLLYRLQNPQPQADGRFGSRISSAGDVTGDGAPDIVVGASSNDVPAGCGQQNPVGTGCHKDQGQAFVFDGRTGALVRTLDLPAAAQPAPSCSGGGGGSMTANTCGSFGLAVQGPGDTNGDGVPDQLVDAASLDGVGKLFIFSGKTGDLLLAIADPRQQQGADFGFQDAAPLSPGDVNGDGSADLYGNGFLQDGPAGKGQGMAWIFDGRTGKVLYQLNDPTPTAGGQFGWSESTTGYNSGGTPAVYVGQSPHEVPNTPGDGGTYVFDGRTGKLLQSLELPPSDRQPVGADNLGPSLGWSSASPGDLNGDGEPDYVATAPFEDVGQNKDQGALYVYLSAKK